MGDQADQIVALDPGHPLLAGADRSAEAELERRQHPREEAAFGAEHQADAQTNDPHAVSAAGPAALSQASHSSWLKQACDFADSVSTWSCHSPYQPIAEPVTSTAGLRRAARSG